MSTILSLVEKVNLEANDEFPGFPDKDLVVDVYGQNIQNELVVYGEDARVEQGLFEAT